MTLIETEFTPWLSLAGGVLIGLSALLLMASVGRIMGATGLLAGFILPQSSEDWGWRATVLAGMTTAPLIYLLVAGQGPEIQIPSSTPLLVIGGVLVGIGVTFGGGCTSGHGVCGMARLSRRSIAATLVFMAGAVVAVFVLRHVIGG